MSTTNTPQNANYFNGDVSKHGFSLFSVRATGESVFTYLQNASTHGPPACSAILVNLGGSFFPRNPAVKRVRNASELNWHCRLGFRVPAAQRVLDWEPLRSQMSMSAPVRRLPD